MKKWALVIMVFAVISVIATYYFIPEKLVISSVSVAKVTMNGAVRMLSTDHNWAKWWINEGGVLQGKVTSFNYYSLNYQLISHQNNSIEIRIKDGNFQLNTKMILVSLSIDSTAFLWNCEYSSGKNPFDRLRAYFKAVEIKKSTTAVLENLSAFLSNPKNVYGIDIYKGSINDTMLLSAKYYSPAEPSTKDVYHYLKLVEENIKKQKATVTGSPLLNISRIGKGFFETQVALPTSKWLKDDSIFLSRRMIKGNFMIADVNGGAYTANEAMEAVENYITDYHKIKVAKAFQYLISNRQMELDTLKWKTRIYIPVVE